MDFLGFLWLRRYESNIRPQGYEPCELPLLYSAIYKWYDEPLLRVRLLYSAIYKWYDEPLLRVRLLYSAIYKWYDEPLLRVRLLYFAIYGTGWMVPMSGLEPPTSALWVPCSNQLSYIGESKSLTPSDYMEFWNLSICFFTVWIRLCVLLGRNLLCERALLISAYDIFPGFCPPSIWCSIR